MSARPTVRCRKMLERVSAYLEGDLNAAGCRAVERHCRECVTCARLIEGLRRAVGMCREAGSRPLPASVREKARASVQRLLAGEAAVESRRRR